MRSKIFTSFFLLFFINCFREDDEMKSVIPFTKDLEFSTKISEITSISLEREFSLEGEEIKGFLFVTGEYKSHDISANVLPFSYKIPFTIEVPENLKKEDLTLEITDFAYDIKSEKEITVNVELELCYSLEEKEEEEVLPSVNSDEMIKMMEERKEEVPVQPEPEVKKEEVKEEPPVQEERNESEDVIMNTVSDEEEYITYHIHIVKEGETLESICSLYKADLNLVKTYNDTDNLMLGSKVIIPVDDES